MVVVDVPVHTSQDSISRRLNIITLPRAGSQAIGLLHIRRQALQFFKRRTTIGILIILRSAISICTGSRTSSQIVLNFTIDEEEQLVLDNRATKGCTKGIGMTIVNRQGRRTYAVTFQRGAGEIGIGTPLEIVSTTLGDSIDTTTCESALTNVIRSDRDSHLIQCVK